MSNAVLRIFAQSFSGLNVFAEAPYTLLGKTSSWKKKIWFSEFLALVKRVFWQVYNQKLSNIQEDITKTQQKFQAFAKCRGHHDNFWYWPLEKECVRVRKVSQKFLVHMFSEIFGMCQGGINFLSKIFRPTIPKNFLKGTFDVWQTFQSSEKCTVILSENFCSERRKIS